MRSQKQFIQILVKNIFTAGDSVEAFDYNPSTRQLAVTSHYGRVSLYELLGGELYLVWSKELPDCIPRAIRFEPGSARRVIIFALETGKLWVFDCCDRIGCIVSNGLGLQNLPGRRDCLRNKFKDFLISYVSF